MKKTFCRRPPQRSFGSVWFDSNPVFAVFIDDYSVMRYSRHHNPGHIAPPERPLLIVCDSAIKICDDIYRVFGHPQNEKDKSWILTLIKGNKKSQSNANELSQQQSGSESTFQFLDIRSEAIAQRKLQETANNSPRAMQFKLIQEMANNSPQVKQTAQFQAMAHRSHYSPSTKTWHRRSASNESGHCSEKLKYHRLAWQSKIWNRELIRDVFGWC